MKRPSFQFYPADWRNDAALRMCSLGARGLWWEMLCIMHTCEPYGHLVAAGRPIEADELGRIVGESAKDVRKWLAELERHAIFSRTPEGVIYSRRMARDEIERGKWRDRQGKSRSKTEVVTPVVTPASQSSSSSSTSSSSSEVAAAEASQGNADQLNRLGKLLGFNETNHAQFAANLRTLVDLKAEKCDFTKHILPAAEQAAKSGRAKSLAYVRPKAIELRDADKIVASMPAPFEQTDEAGWKGRAFAWLDKGLWSSKWGPKPGEPDCKCPPELLKSEAA